MKTNKSNSVIFALSETVAVGAVYISLAHLAVARDVFAASRWFPGFSGLESEVAASFTTGVIAQAAIVALLIALPCFPQVRQAISTLRQPAAARGWNIAISVLVIDVVVLYVGWIGDFGKLLDTSAFGLSMSLVPAMDGITQEIVFRGYVLLRLAGAGVSRIGQILVSGVLFASLHFSYGTDLDLSSCLTVLMALIPFAGTFGLGAAWAFAFQESGYRLLPVVVSHVLVVFLIQPWLAMSYAMG